MYGGYEQWPSDERLSHVDSSPKFRGLRQPVSDLLVDVLLPKATETLDASHHTTDCKETVHSAY